MVTKLQNCRVFVEKILEVPVLDFVKASLINDLNCQIH